MSTIEAQVMGPELDVWPAVTEWAIPDAWEPDDGISAATVVTGDDPIYKTAGQYR
jgi:chitodextrinase